MRAWMAVFGILVAALAQPAVAWGEVASPRERAGFVVREGAQVDALPLVRQRTVVEVVGVVAHITITQEWRNAGTTPLEADYLFPTSTTAALHELRLRINDQRELRAELRPKEQAQKMFDAARDAGQTAGLLEQQRPNVMQMHLTNILPNDVITVTVEASELLRPKSGTYELVLPQTLGARYRGGSDGFVDNGHVAGAGSGVDTVIDVTVRSPIGVRRLGSPTHAIAPRFADKNVGTVHVESQRTGPGADVVADRDFVLRWQLADGAIHTGVLLFRDKERPADSTFLLLGEAPPAVDASAAAPREVIFVVDVSGSMHGFPLEKAKVLVQELVAELDDDDRFNILFFSGGSTVLAPEGSLAPTKDNRARALAMLDGASAGGGTELLPALQTALALPRPTDDPRARAIVVVTDGNISAERAAFDLVRTAEATVFAFGIGASVNRYLIEGLAAAGRTEPFTMTSLDADAAVQRFRTVSLRPALSRVRVAFDGFDAVDLEPSRPDDLYPGRPLVMLGHFKGPSSGRVVVTGVRGDGGRYESVVPIEDHLEQPGHRVLQQLWARERIARLADRSTPTASETAEVEALGLRHRLLTERTSFVVVDPAVRNKDGRLAVVAQPNVRPVDVDGSGGAVGAAYGAAPGASYGVGGLGLVGTGRGGGGGGYGVGGVGVGTGRGTGREPPAPRVSAGALTVQGSIDRQIIRRVMAQNMGTIRYCYERELVRTPTLAGKLVLQLVIDGTGAVQRVTTAEESTLKSAAVSGCMEKAALRWRFPAPPGGGTVTVNYPFLFQPE
jgi:Ca-activated chloride channel family protein